MAYSGLDPRKDIREYIGTARDLLGDGKDKYCITVSYRGNHFIPIYTTEESKSDIIPPLPFIEFGLLDSKAEPHDIRASTRKNEAIIDVNIYWTAQDNIDSSDFGKAISDKLYDLIRSNQCTILGTNSFINVNRTGKVFIENYGKQVVYHKNMEIYVLYYDKP